MKYRALWAAIVVGGLRRSADTARAAWDWFQHAFPADYDFGREDGDGIPRARALELLAAWHATPMGER